MEDEFTAPDKITEAMKAGLARMYADDDFRSYLQHAINIANHNVLVYLKGNKPDQAKEFAMRIETLKQLLDKGKTLYINAEKLKSKPLEELIKEKDEKDNKQNS